ncbi:PIH1 domain containing 1 [Nesidiocoris tenuis]|uniref:PIH1 domain containing 1 n=1 Tax=Nesidiocoris tenuis TaxID=355587 RepID=A0ABN7A7K5_9HEMI|nr:PIH1 domain containing 1 [Nesidiocoris tenuis]
MKGVKLEIDPSIMEKNLLFTERSSPPSSDDFDPISKLFHPGQQSETGEDLQEFVRPSPGFCVKMLKADGGKVFANICHTANIPAPQEITDEELIEILESDSPSSFKCPLSIGNLRDETDKSGNPCLVVDVAINSAFCQKLQKNELFRTFFLLVVSEGIQEKFRLELKTEKPNSFVVLKNRKQIGTLQIHSIRKRPKEPTPPKSLIQVLSSEDHPADVSEEKTPKTDVSPVPLPDDSCKVKLFVAPQVGEPQILLALLKVKALSGSDIELDVSRRKLIVSCERNEKLDCDLPYDVLPGEAVAQYFVNLQVID